MNASLRSRISPDLHSILLLTAAVLIFFAPAALVRGVYFLGDANDYFARLAYTTARLKEGQIALWNPYLSLGGTHAGDPAALAWYLPALALFLILPSAVAFNYTVLFHYWLAAVGMYLLARAWRKTRAASVLAGLIYAFSGFAIAHLQHLNILIGLAWLPIIFYCVEGFFQTRRARFIALGCFALAFQILGGHAQIVLYGALALGAYIIVMLVRIGRAGDRKWLTQATVSCTLMVVGAFGLAAIFLVPFLELLGFTPRAGGVSYDFATTFSLEPLRLIAFVYPYFFGGNPGTVEHGAGSLIEMSSYVGLLTLALVPLAFLRPIGRAAIDWRVIFLGVLAVATLLLALGRYTPLYAMAFQLPLLKSVRAPARFLVLDMFSVALLAGFGLDALREARAKRRLLDVLTGLLTLFAAFTLGLYLLSLSRIALPKSLSEADSNPALLAAFIFAAGASVVLLLWSRGIFTERVRLVFTLALVAADLFFFAWNFRWNYVVSPAVYEMPGAIAAKLMKEGDAGRLFYWGSGETKQATFLQEGAIKEYVNLARAGLRQSLPMMFGLLSMQGYGSEPPNFTALNNGIDETGDFGADQPRLIGMYNGGNILTQSQIDSPSLDLILKENGVNLYRNRDALPRALIVGTAKAVDGLPALLQAIQSPGFDPGSMVLVEDKSLERSGSLDPNSNVRIQTDKPEDIVIQTINAKDSFLVLNDSFYPGWRASVDSEPAAIHRANGLVRAVAVPAGSHTVEFVYDPMSVKIGALVSVMTLLVVGGILIFDIYRERKRKSNG